MHKTMVLNSFSGSFGRTGADCRKRPELATAGKSFSAPALPAATARPGAGARRNAQRLHSAGLIRCVTGQHALCHIPSDIAAAARRSIIRTMLPQSSELSAPKETP